MSNFKATLYLMVILALIALVQTMDYKEQLADESPHQDIYISWHKDALAAMEVRHVAAR